MMPSSDCRTRCVLLAPKGDRDQGRGEILRSLLDRRGWIAHEANDPLAALAELCVLQRTQASRRAWGLTPAESLALVVVEPKCWPQLEAMLAAARRYLPQADQWSFVNGGLHPIGADGPGSEPRRREAEAPPAVPDGTDDVSPPPVSGEEIAMLLEGEDRDPS